jgi:hypothetical protein
MKIINSIAVLTFLAFSGAAYAQSPAGAVGGAAGAATGAVSGAAGAATGTAGKAMKSAKPRSAKSMECSKQADTQKLHGKDRRHFMSKCKKM